MQAKENRVQVSVIEDNLLVKDKTTTLIIRYKQHKISTL